jgi:hypothetical protein
MTAGEARKIASVHRDLAPRKANRTRAHRREGTPGRRAARRPRQDALPAYDSARRGTSLSGNKAMVGACP